MTNPTLSDVEHGRAKLTDAQIESIKSRPGSTAYWMPAIVQRIHTDTLTRLAQDTDGEHHDMICGKLAALGYEIYPATDGRMPRQSSVYCRGNGAEPIANVIDYPDTTTHARLDY